jgi:hypothetical protein
MVNLSWDASQRHKIKKLQNKKIIIINFLLKKIIARSLQ